MKLSERGFTLVELLVVIAIMSLITLGATMTTFQIINVTRRSNDHVAAVRQVQNAGYWISRDALMAESVVVDDAPETEEELELELEFLTLTWTEWDYDETEVSEYHEVIYSFPALSGGIRKLERNYVIYDDEGGKIGSKTNLIAEYIYYNPIIDPDGTTKADYENPPVLTVQITSSLGEASETKEYRVGHRPDF